MREVLVLNADYTPLSLIPLSIVSWKDAFSLIYVGKASAIEYYDKYISTSTQRFQVPSVIVLNKHKKVSHKPKYSKYNIKLRDNFTCQYCNTRRSPKSLTVDHVLPKSKGGKTKWTNIVAACKPCNQGKKDNHRITPKIKPIRPTYYDLASKFSKVTTTNNLHWQPYLPKFKRNKNSS